LVDSVTANNPFGVCQDPKTKALSNGEKSFEQYFKEAVKKVENVKECYDSTGMGTSCLATEVQKQDSTALALALVAMQMAAWIKKGHTVSNKMRLIASRIVLNYNYMAYWTVWFEEQTGAVSMMDLDSAIAFERNVLDAITDLRYEIGTLDWQVMPCTCEDDCACRFVHNPF